jgi:hypothetical protein
MTGGGWIPQKRVFYTRVLLEIVREPVSRCWELYSYHNTIYVVQIKFKFPPLGGGGDKYKYNVKNNSHLVLQFNIQFSLYPEIQVVLKGWGGGS